MTVLTVAPGRLPFEPDAAVRLPLAYIEEYHRDLERLSNYPVLGSQGRRHLEDEAPRTKMVALEDDVDLAEAA